MLTVCIGTTDSEMIIEVADKYLNAFINSKGGTLYFGIHDNGTVIGQKMIDTKKQDELTLGIDQRLKTMETKKNWFN